MSEQQQPEKTGIEGVFSNQEIRKVGTGTTTRKTIQKSYWYAIEQENGDIELQPLNLNYVPTGPKKRVTKDEFLEKFSPEPEFYVSNVFPKIKEVNKTIARAERYRANKEYYSAEMEYGNALKVDEDNIRANFGLGITYLERGENNKAEDILTRLVKLDGAFEAEHKHLFNDFGINLRKSGMLDQSISYYTRALELSSQDENLYYNLARVYLEKKDPGQAVDLLLKGLELNPTQETLLKFLMWMLTKELVPADKKPLVAVALQKAKTAAREQASSPRATQTTPAAQPEAPEQSSADGEKRETATPVPQPAAPQSAKEEQG